MVTGALFNSLKFGEVDSADYGIYIDGEGVFNAPARDVEMISVPGRNGDITLDLGRYENITVNYPAGIYGDDQTDFRERFSDFRNAVLSQKGYQRLSDTYHPDEFRMGVYASGLDINPVHYNEAGQFTLSFNCKPQRFLVEGEEKISVTSGDSITNETLFDAAPLVEVEGYGVLSVGGQEIEIENGLLGYVELPLTYNANNIEYPIVELNSGDDLTLKNFRIMVNVQGSSSLVDGFVTVTVEDSSHQTDNFPPSHNLNYSSGSRVFTDSIRYGDQYFNVGRNTSKTDTFTYTCTTRKGTTSTTRTLTLTVEIANRVLSDPEKDYIRITFTKSGSWTQTFSASTAQVGTRIIGNSTQPIMGHPTYLDCELGDAYKIEGGVYVSLNNYIIFGADLPSLKPGDTEVEFDNTITDLKIIPRWWKL